TKSDLGYRPFIRYLQGFWPCLSSRVGSYFVWLKLETSDIINTDDGRNPVKRSFGGGGEIVSIFMNCFT
ncbi:MAG: hypothetical protein WCB47_24110, partial [Pseudolabrys sp.]